MLNWMQLISRKPDHKKWAIIKGDISKYFYRVDHSIIMDIYAGITDDAWFLWLIGEIINNPKLPFGLPEGVSADNCPREQRLYDVGIAPALKTYTTDTCTEYDISFRVVRGVIPWDGLEDDIRTRYEAWCESGEVIEI